MVSVLKLTISEIHLQLEHYSYIFICVDSHGAMNFSYQIFDRDGSPESIPLVPYLVLAYDIESDDALYDGDGVSFPASVNNISHPGNRRGNFGYNYHMNQLCVRACVTSPLFCSEK